MNISELVSLDLIFFEESINNQDDLFQLLSSELKDKNIVSNKEKFILDLYKREEEVSTGIEDGFGIPHAKSKYVTKAAISFVRTSPMKDYKGLDGKPIDHIFLLAIPEEAKDTHLNILSSLSRKLVNENFRKRLKKATTKNEILEILDY